MGGGGVRGCVDCVSMSWPDMDWGCTVWVSVLVAVLFPVVAAVVEVVVPSPIRVVVPFPIGVVVPSPIGVVVLSPIGVAVPFPVEVTVIEVTVVQVTVVPDVVTRSFAVEFSAKTTQNQVRVLAGSFSLCFSSSSPGSRGLAPISAICLA